jgi:hypothetical protein
MALITISHNMLAVYSLRVFSSSFLNYFTTLYQEALADFVFIVGEKEISRYIDDRNSLSSSAYPVSPLV